MVFSYERGNPVLAPLRIQALDYHSSEFGHQNLGFGAGVQPGCEILKLTNLSQVDMLVCSQVDMLVSRYKSFNVAAIPFASRLPFRKSAARHEKFGSGMSESKSKTHANSGNSRKCALALQVDEPE